MTASVYSRALLRAVALLGGRDPLARVLGVPRDELDGWIGDDTKPPRELFLRVIDIILDAADATGGPTPDTPPHDAAGSSQRYID